MSTSLATLQAQLTAVNATLTTLYGKAVDSYSIQQRNLHYRSIRELEESRDRLEAKIAAVGAGGRGTTARVYFSDPDTVPDRTLDNP